MWLVVCNVACGVHRGAGTVFSGVRYLPCAHPGTKQVLTLNLTVVGTGPDLDSDPNRNLNVVKLSNHEGHEVSAHNLITSIRVR